jgi:hypothetical protein
MKWKRSLKKQTVLNFLVLCPIFLVFSLLLSQWWNGREMDFAAYWQAGHMILSGQNVYDSEEWIAVRQLEGTALHSELTFQYPTPLAILFSPMALLPVQSAYTLWMFFAQIALLASIIILLGFYPTRSGYFELLTITGIFFFRPSFSVINSGQILTPLLLLLSVSIWLFHHGYWFAGGSILSILSLKPSIGFPILILAGLWLLSRKQWRGILGMILGGLALVVFGAAVNSRWIIDYVNIGGNSFRKYYGMHPTFWGVIDRIFQIDSLSLVIGFLVVAVVLAVEAYLFWGNKSKLEAFDAFASILPAALLIAPYSWNYDQILLTIPIVFLLISISVRYGTGKAALFMFGVVALAFGMVTIAYFVEHDVWSVMNSLVVWVFSLYFVIKGTNSNAVAEAA